uniref:Uncharacterized protein n=1 Tax=Roseihalotalea indica TaxID=2867963 RepID=A0AA49JJU0_9BACT|nr:hypothetical protein K4G66_14775 [Tunicatimonas sp. TK19036]
MSLNLNSVAGGNQQEAVRGTCLRPSASWYTMKRNQNNVYYVLIGRLVRRYP